MSKKVLFPKCFKCPRLSGMQPQIVPFFCSAIENTTRPSPLEWGLGTRHFSGVKPLYPNCCTPWDVLHTHTLTEEFHLQPATQCICPDGLTDPICMILIVKSMKNKYNMFRIRIQTVCLMQMLNWSMTKSSIPIQLLTGGRRRINRLSGSSSSPDIVPSSRNGLAQK